MPAIINIPGGPIPAGSTPIYRAKIVDGFGRGISAASLDTLTLTIVDTKTETIINDCDQVDILNTGRGTLDGNGNLAVQLLAGDTSMSEVPGLPQVQRALVFDWTYNFGTNVGRHQASFMLVALAGP